MQAKELMRVKVRSIVDDASLAELVDMLVSEHMHGLPVLDAQGQLVGVVTQQDVFFGTMMSGEQGQDPSVRERLKVRDIMTSPAVSADETTEIRTLCRMMFKLRIHRVPITSGKKLIGIISSLDICSAIARGQSLD